MRNIRETLTSKTTEQTKLRKTLADLAARKSELNGSVYEEAVGKSVIETQLKGIRSEMMQNRLGENGLRSLNKELKDSREE